MKQLLFDCHSHSENSPDAGHSVIFMCEQAMEKGLSGIAVTDHCECNLYEQDDYKSRIRQSFLDIRRCQSVLPQSFSLYAGIELGQPLQDLQAAEDALRSNPYDFVLASLHNIRDEEDFYYLDYHSEEHEPYALLNRYFEELYDMCRWGEFDSLAHLTYPIRYISGRDKIPVDLKRYSGQIDDILKLLIQKGKALELNTSGLRQEIGTFVPSEDIVRRFYELGGELVTLGSDSHAAEFLGMGIAEGTGLLKRIGFSSFAVYSRREPALIKMI